MFSYEVKFITCDESLYLKNGDFKSYKYETKKRAEESVYDAGKRSFCERRGGNWRASRPRQIRQLCSKLRDRSVVFCEWMSENLITIVFSSGAIAYLTVKPETLDVTQVLIDRYCVGKLSSQAVVGVVLSRTHLLFMHADKLATLVSFGKSATAMPCRISDRDPHIQSIELGGGARRAERRISSRECGAGVRALVWAPAAVEPAPWRPAAQDLANLHLYHFNGQQVSLIAYHQLENDTLSAELSHKSDNVIHIVEQVASHKTGVTLDWLRYEVPSEERGTKLSSLRESATQASLPAPVRVVARAPSDDRLLAACIDGSLHIVHHAAGATHSTRAGFIATDVRWAGEVLLAVEEGGRLQCFDRALSLLNHHTKCLDFATYLRDPRRLQLLATRSMKGGPLILASFAGGPLALLRIMHPRILTAWLRSGRTSNAVSLLQTLDWDAEGSEGLWAVNTIIQHSLRAPHGGTGESSAQAALGAYLAPLAPHGAGADRLAPALHDLARKFFHHLLRRGRIEKAMSLAVDLSDWDLFMDASRAAARRGLTALCGEAAGLASQLGRQDSNSSESCSQCSSRSYSETDDELSVTSDNVQTKPPPLPRVFMPQPQNPQKQPQNPQKQTQNPQKQTQNPQKQPQNPQNPTIVHVPITQTEPTSTNSIRPNLHQYLERDNTIWNTAVRDDTQIKPILSNTRWHSVDNVLLNFKSPKHLMPINETYDDRMTPAHFRHLLQTELREDVPNTLYRYQSNSYLPSSSLRQYREEPERSRTEKNKVKFSDTVTIAVVADPSPPCPSPARELAESLPLCPPHAYLAAFAPLPPAPGTAPRDYVEV